MSHPALDPPKIVLRETCWAFFSIIHLGCSWGNQWLYVDIYMIYIYMVYITIYHLYNHTCWGYIPTNGGEVTTQPSINRDSPESAPPNPLAKDDCHWLSQIFPRFFPMKKTRGLPGLPRYVELLEPRMLQDGTSHSHVARRMQGAAVAFRWLFTLAGAETAYYYIISYFQYKIKL